MLVNFLSWPSQAYPTEDATLAKELVRRRLRAAVRIANLDPSGAA